MGKRQGGMRRAAREERKKEAGEEPAKGAGRSACGKGGGKEPMRTGSSGRFCCGFFKPSRTISGASLSSPGGASSSSFASSRIWANLETLRRMLEGPCFASFSSTSSRLWAVWETSWTHADGSVLVSCEAVLESSWEFPGREGKHAKIVQDLMDPRSQ